METVFVDNDSGYQVPIHWTPGSEGPVIVILGALSTPAPFYQRLTTEIGARGWPVAVVEQRGLGASALRPSHDVDWSFADVLHTDLPAALGWVREQAPDRPLVLLGHSLGGHYAAMAAGLYAEHVDGVVLAACGTPWVGAFEDPVRSMIQHLGAVIPTLCAERGYYPGEEAGFGGDEACGVMADWRHLAQTNRFRLGEDEETVAGLIGQYDGPVLAIGMSEDDFAPPAAVAASVDRFPPRPTERVLTTEEIEMVADHFGWARKPSAVVKIIADWWAEAT
ncbi:MAG: alpha/beta fold hydrolase [Nocardioidaceae bacterium]|nr:alpha/beta fold hydrolase [Nocardioidaceae bacterium]